MEDRARQRKVPTIRQVPKRVISVHRVEPVILESVGSQLRHETDSAAFLVFINHQAGSLVRNRVHRQVELLRTVAAERTECLSGETLRMEPH